VSDRRRGLRTAGRCRSPGGRRRGARPALPNVPLALDSVDEIPPTLGRLGEGIERNLRTRVQTNQYASWNSAASGKAPRATSGCAGCGCGRCLPNDRAFRDRLPAHQGEGSPSARGRAARGGGLQSEWFGRDHAAGGRAGLVWMRSMWRTRRSSSGTAAALRCGDGALESPAPVCAEGSVP
jgi:hypothetical protein